jgi:hypothetical protein
MESMTRGMPKSWSREKKIYEAGKRAGKYSKNGKDTQLRKRAEQVTKEAVKYLKPRVERVGHKLEPHVREHFGSWLNYLEKKFG